ncbi:MAG: general secretion pathway protein GspK [Planctomycetales bacterium]|nr:general secretion pathway protein GspK [Planctomycetales bacterium]
MNRTPPQRDVPPQKHAPRRGALLVLVLIVVSMLSLTGYAFTEMMFTENMAVTIHGRQLQATAGAESAVELVKSIVARPPDQIAEFGGLYDNPERLRGVIVNTGDDGDDLLRFTVLTTRLEDNTPIGIRYGVTDESAKLNLWALLEWDKAQPGTARAALLALPNMTEELADHLLDWIDADNSPREFGAEASVYATLDPPYAPRNSVPPRLEELLLVVGVTRQLLLGNDLNLNGQIDPNEVAESATMSSMLTSMTNADGAPWSEFLTLDSAESNVDPNGENKLDLNSVSVEALTARLPLTDAQGFAEFVDAYRTFGPLPAQNAAASRPAPVTSTSNPSTSAAAGTSSTIRSVFDLVDARVGVPARAGRPAGVLESPLRSGDPEPLGEWLAVLEQWTTTDPRPRIAGRVNVNLAPSVVLQAVPGITTTTAEAIAARRGFEQSTAPAHLGWLLIEGLLDLETLRQVAPFLTTSGDVSSFQCLGYFDSRGPVSRFRVTLDATSFPPAVISWSNLQRAPLGFGPQELGVGEGPPRR